MKTLKETIKTLKEQGVKSFCYEYGFMGIAAVETALTELDERLLNKKVLKMVKYLSDHVYLELN